MYLLTSDVVDAPLIMIGKIVAPRRERVGKVVGSLDRDTLLRVNRGFALWLGLGD